LEYAAEEQHLGTHFSPMDDICFISSNTLTGKTTWVMRRALAYARTEERFEDSILPVMTAELAEQIDDDFALEDTCRVERTPRHSTGPHGRRQFRVYERPNDSPA